MTWDLRIPSLADVLNKIVERKRQEIAEAKRLRPLDKLRREVESAPAVRDFVGALKAMHPMGLIAEVKKASPSAGLIRADFDPVAIAKAYAESGAACISVLTDEHFFQGHLDFLVSIRGEVGIPLLRKDFPPGSVSGLGSSCGRGGLYSPDRGVPGRF